VATTLTNKNEEFKVKKWENVNCPICSAKDSRLLEKFGPDHRYTYVRCISCGLAYLNPRPRYNEEFINTAYSVYLPDLSDLWVNNSLTKEGKKQYDWANKSIKKYENFVKPGRFLEVGCARGLYSKVAKDRGWETKAVDISKTMIDLARKVFGIDAIHGDWLNVIPNSPKFDLIYCSHVIEHIPNPNEWMLGFKEILNPNGILVIEVPNMNSPDRKFKRNFKRIGLRKDKWAKWRTPDHLFEPDENSFKYLISVSGFSIVTNETYSRKHNSEKFLQHFYHSQLRWGSNLRFVLKPK